MLKYAIAYHTAKRWSLNLYQKSRSKGFTKIKIDKITWGQGIQSASSHQRYKSGSTLSKCFGPISGLHIKCFRTDGHFCHQWLLKQTSWWNLPQKCPICELFNRVCFVTSPIPETLHISTHSVNLAFWPNPGFKKIKLFTFLSLKVNHIIGKTNFWHNKYVLQKQTMREIFSIWNFVQEMLAQANRHKIWAIK